MLITLCSIVNALLLESYKEEFFNPLYIEIPVNSKYKYVSLLYLVPNDYNLFFIDKNLNYIFKNNDNFTIVSNNFDSRAKNLNRDQINEENAQNRLLEKKFFKGIIEIMLYLNVFLVILLFGYEYSYVDLKIYSNHYLRHLISETSSWNKVNSFVIIKYNWLNSILIIKVNTFDHFLDWSLYERKQMINKDGSSENFEFIKAFKHIRFTQNNRSWYLKPQFYRGPSKLDNHTTLLKLEAYFYNNSTSVWTYLQGIRYLYKKKP